MLDNLKKVLSEGKEYRIVFLGDSITSCEWVHPNWREITEYVLKFCEELDDLEDWKNLMWGIRSINCGYDGSTTGDILNMMDRVLSYKPDLVLFPFGRNDLDTGIFVDNHKVNTKAILELLSKNVANTFFFSTIPCADDEINRKYEEYVEAEKALFPIENVRFVDLFKLYQEFDYKRFFSFVHDGSEPGTIIGAQDIDHPNSLGNAYIAKVVLKEVWGIEFDPELYIKETNEGKKFPGF